MTDLESHRIAFQMGDERQHVAAAFQSFGECRQRAMADLTEDRLAQAPPSADIPQGRLR